MHNFLVAENMSLQLLSSVIADVKTSSIIAIRLYFRSVQNMQHNVTAENHYRRTV